MSFFLEHTERILQQYTGKLPLAVFLKAYYKQYPKLGSRDRKALTEAAFIYYRCRRFFADAVSPATVIAAGIALCNSTNAFLQKMIPPQASESDTDVLLSHALPDFASLLSPGLPANRWLSSLWQQPELFIRLRRRIPENLALLQQHAIDVAPAALTDNPSQDSFRIANGAAVDRILPEEDYVVQDLSSQQSIYTLLKIAKDTPHSVWDVCSGAGGKSILLKDKLPSFSLLASDIRESILHNLQMRFRKYGLGRAETLVLNSASTTEVASKIKGRQFDLVLCDVPCSGSGTWARTPEEFHFFEEKQLETFEALQYPIAHHASEYVASGGLLAYITCSVFEKENEQVVRKLQQDSSLQLIHQQLIDGIDNRADCMFLALFRKQ